jgi:6-phosphogluconate dehydrogenase (decarboxylating)
MVHNGMEYGIMGAYAEGLAILRSANIGKQANGAADAETTPLRDPEHYQYDLNLRDIAEVWRRGSVIASWLLDLTASALLQDPNLSKFAGHVSDSSEKHIYTGAKPPSTNNSIPVMKALWSELRIKAHSCSFLAGTRHTA